MKFQNLKNIFLPLLYPPIPLRLINALLFKNPHLFVESHLSTIKANSDKINYNVYLDRLINFKKCIENFT
ncbi:hypothetical protein SAMN00777080_5085 [Aquiflexum balticum DSM 16537]|uniref:DUF6965 domain-containing protein n=1 Tax=Aquiflexum balticum DSM 16537 TaxID=758820 RepID=A0A1W2HD00_9BACT|nr:hypothetical protein SAMN00777080_5085 [Aquiflexum balticum DSM 16537]